MTLNVGGTTPIKFGNLLVTKTQVRPEEETNASITVQNLTNETENIPVELRIDGLPRQEQVVVLNSCASELITFSLRFGASQVGPHSIRVGTAEATVTVIYQTPPPSNWIVPAITWTTGFLVAGDFLQRVCIYLDLLCSAEKGFAPQIDPKDIKTDGIAFFPINQLLVRLQGVKLNQARKLLQNFGAHIIGYFPAVHTYLLRFNHIDGLKTDQEKLDALNKAQNNLEAGLPKNVSLWVMKNYLGALEEQNNNSAPIDDEKLPTVDRQAFDAIKLGSACRLARSHSKPLGAVNVGFIDTGIYNPHQEFKEIIKGGKSYATYESWAEDTQGHGTSVIGIVSAKNGNGGMNGVMSCLTENYKTQIFKIDAAADKSNKIAMPISSTLDAIRKIFDRGNPTLIESLVGQPPKRIVINMSFGWQTKNVSKSSEMSYIYKLFQDYMAAYPRITFVTSAGNEGINLNRGDMIHAPGGVDAPNNITVAATTADGHSVASFSNRGTAIDVAAPGTGIYTTENDGGYTSPKGTSFSAPFVAGTAAILLALDPTLEPKQIKEILLSSGRKLGDSESILLNACAAVLKLIQAKKLGKPNEDACQNSIR